MQTLLKINQGINNWLVAPETNAAGRLGLYRILYAVFFLTYLPLLNVPQLGTLPAGEWHPVLSALWLANPPSVMMMQMIQFVLVAGLALLVVGFQTRLATLMVFLTGLAILSVRFSFGKIDHANTFMMVYIPFLMLFYNWGNTYSVDAILKVKNGRPVPDTSSSGLSFDWPIKVVLWLLCILFGTGGFLKLINAWLVDFETIPKLMYSYNLRLIPNPLNPIVASTPLLYIPLHFGALCFETLFPLAVINRLWRRFFLSSAIFFHLFIMTFMYINFVAMLITYAIFIDWQKVYEFLGRPGHTLHSRLQQRRPIELAVSALFISILLVGTWYTLTNNGLMAVWEWDLWYYWVFAIPTALYGVITSGIGLLRGIPALMHREQSAQVSISEQRQS